MNPNGSLAIRATIAAAILLPSALLSVVSANREYHSKVVVAESSLPDRVEGWESESVPLTETERSMLDSPAASQRVYTNSATGDRVQILLLQVNNTQNAHDPKLCMAGSGYTLATEQVQPCPWKSGSAAFSVSRAEFVKGLTRVTMYYWLQTPNGAVADMSGGFKLEGIRRALVGMTVKGVAVRVIALPNARTEDVATDPRIAESLWRKISGEIRFDSLVAGM